MVTKESLVSFCWRLIPYWLNSWEQQWGAECSSVMFELPHFALELLVVLPCVQVCSCVSQINIHFCGIFLKLCHAHLIMSPQVVDGTSQHCMPLFATSCIAK